MNTRENLTSEEQQLNELLIASPLSLRVEKIDNETVIVMKVGNEVIEGNEKIASILRKHIAYRLKHGTIPLEVVNTAGTMELALGVKEIHLETFSQTTVYLTIMDADHNSIGFIAAEIDPLDAEVAVLRMQYSLYRDSRTDQIVTQDIVRQRYERKGIMQAARAALYAYLKQRGVKYADTLTFKNNTASNEVKSKTKALAEGKYHPTEWRQNPTKSDAYLTRTYFDRLVDHPSSYQVTPTNL